MPTLWPIPTFGILWIIWKVLLHRRDRRVIQQHQCAPIPSYPHKDPFLGYDLHRLLEKSKQTNSLLPTIETLYRTYGNGRTFKALTWGIPTLYTTDPKNIQAVLATHFDRFGVEPIRKAFNDPWIGAGIVTSDGPLWKSSRAILKPLFAKSQFADFNKLEIHVSNLICTLEVGRGMVDLQPHFSHLVCSAICVISWVSMGRVMKLTSTYSVCQPGHGIPFWSSSRRAATTGPDDCR